jgi:hypothetical protein
MYLLYLWCTSYKYQSILEQSFNQYTRYRYGTKFRYQSIRPPLTHAQGGLLLGVGDGGRVVRYSTLFLPKKSLRVWWRLIGGHFHVINGVANFI